MRKLIIFILACIFVSCLDIDNSNSNGNKTSNEEFSNVYVTINNCHYEEKIFSFRSGNEIIIKEKKSNSQYTNTNKFIDWLQKNNLYPNVSSKNTTIDQWGNLLTKIEFKKNTEIMVSYV